MIRVGPPITPLTPPEQFGWVVLRDLSRLLSLDEAPPVPPPDAAAGRDRPGLDVVRVQFTSDERARERTSASAVEALRAGFVVRDGAVEVSRAVLAAVADVAGAAGDQRCTVTDRHGRVPSAENPLVRAGAERQPVVSRAAADLRTAVAQAAGRRPVLTLAPWPGGHRWAAALSHDVDVLAAWPVFTTLRIAELARKGQTALAATVAIAASRHALGDPATRGVESVLDAERRASVTSTWFVLCGTPTLATFRRGDLTYRPESARARRMIDTVRGGGHELGLHGSFATVEDDGAFRAQRTRLAALVSEPPVGVRQHFLRMRPGATQRAMADAGFLYDATYGFSDRNGFRLGVADIVPGWDADHARQAALEEVPLVWMDRAQSKYQNVEDPARWVEDALELAAASRAVDGLWVGLWHPNLTPALGFPGAPVAYDRLLQALLDEEPYVAPVARLVAWRRLRRAIRSVETGDGAVALEVPPSRGFDVPILDRDGRAVTTVRAGDDGGLLPLALR